MLSMYLAIAAFITAVGLGLGIGRRRPLLGMMVAAGVILFAVGGYCVMMTFALPM